MWSICILDSRMTICKKPLLWTIAITMFGMFFSSSSVAINCYLAYYDELTSLRYDPKIVIDTLYLNTAKANEDLFYWRMATFGHSFFIAGLEIPIMCRLLNKGVIPKKNRN